MTAQLTAWNTQRVDMPFAEFSALADTHHSEYIDGSLVLNPPTRRHVQIARRLTRALEDVAPAELEVLPEAGWLVAPETVCVPDIMVASSDAPGEDLLRAAPVLVVEVASRSTRAADLGRKRELYASGGAQWYWIVDPEQQSIIVLENIAGTFVETERITEDRQVISEPFALVLDLSEIFGSR